MVFAVPRPGALLLRRSRLHFPFVASANAWLASVRPSHEVWTSCAHACAPSEHARRGIPTGRTVGRLAGRLDDRPSGQTGDRSDGREVARWAGFDRHQPTSTGIASNSVGPHFSDVGKQSADSARNRPESCPTVNRSRSQSVKASLQNWSMSRGISLQNEPLL